MRGAYRAGHLGEAVDAYVDSALDAASAERAARHVLACGPCRREVTQARVVAANLRDVRVDPARQASLVAGLLALAPACAESHPTRHGVGDSTGDARSTPHENRPQAGRDRRPLRVAAGVALGAVAVVTLIVTVAPAQPPAPIAPQLAHAHRPAADEVRAPSIVTIGALQGPEPSEAVTAPRRASGRMGP